MELGDNEAKNAPDGLLYVMFCVRSLYHAHKCEKTITGEVDESAKITQCADVRKSIENAKWANVAKKAV